VADWPPTVTPIGPVAAPTGTVTVKVVVVAETTVAVGFVAPPVNVTMLADGVALKFVPVIVTVVPTGPLVGVKLVIVGGGGSTLKLLPLVPVKPFTVTVIGPVVAPAGTLVVSDVAVAAVTVAAVPLNRTVFDDGVVLKLLPEMVTWAPTGAVAGEKLETTGTLPTTKFVLLGALTIVPTETVIGPVVAAEGTVAVAVVDELAAVVTPYPLK